MAGGIDWFRWHHGSVTDPKFQLVARKAGQSLGNVIAVWAYVLETASAATERGQFGDIDCEAMDCMLGLDEGSASAILAAMDVRGLIRGGAVSNWEKRQPKREDDTAAERKRRQREREHELYLASVTAKASRKVTQGHADVTHGHDREEKSREEEKRETKTARKRAAATQLVSVEQMVTEGVERQCAIDWLANRKAKGLPLTPTAWEQTKSEALKARLSVPEAIKVAAGNAWAGFKASWLAEEPARNGRAPPATVPSAAADQTADYLRRKAEEAKQAVPPPANIREMVRKAVKTA